MSLLDVRDLHVSFSTPAGVVRAVDGVSFAVERGRTLGLVGESGSGKSVTALTVMGLTRRIPGVAVAGEIRLGDRELVAASDDELRRLRGDEVAMVFQDPMSSLHPHFRIGDQVAEAVRAHHQLGKWAARRRAFDMLGHVGLADPGRRMDDYPHELSGGQCQRVMIAMALIGEPHLLIADEPTSALDVTVQAQLLALLARLRDELGMAMVLISHDLGVVAQVADDVAVMRAGRIVETGPRATLLRAPRHPYARELLRSVPRIDDPRRAGTAIPARPAAPLLQVRDLVKDFPVRRGVVFQRDAGVVHAVAGVSFDLRAGEALGLVGESGCGKTTTARLVTRLLTPTSGTVTFDGRDVTTLSRRELLPLRRDVQLVFQDPYGSLDPRMTAGAIVAEPLRIHRVLPDRRARRARVEELLERVGLGPGHHDRYPHELSGGQRQRVGVARAIALGPRLLVADEPVSALDVTVQAQILALLRDLQAQLGLALLFIAHDLAVVRQVCDRVAVMREGRIVEVADVDRLYDAPAHPYTRALLDAVPRVPQA